MCSKEDHVEQLALLERIEKAVLSTAKRPPIDSSPQISASQPLVIDYKDRRHLFLISANALTFTVEDLGTLTVAQNTWTNIGYQEGMRLVPTAQATLVPVFVRATDESLP